MIAILLSGIAATAIGFLWYSTLFSKIWRDGHKFSPAELGALQSSMPLALGVSFVGYLVTAYVLSFILSSLNITEVYGAMRITFILWLGFTAVVCLMHRMYTGSSLIVYAIDMGYTLVYMLATSLILTLWR